MWELIRANNRKSILLFICLAACLLALGYFLGAAFFPPDGGAFGLLIASAVWIFISIISIFSGKDILLSSSQAREVTHDIHPQLFNVTEEMKIAAGLPVMPKLYIMYSPAPNAFATGFDPQDSALVVTSGLLARMNRDELQGVVAHEMGHILNRDVRFVTLAGVLLGSITLIAEFFLRGMRFSGSGRRFSSRGSSGGGQAQLVMILIAIVFAILAPILARVFYFAISRRREYLADATSARLTRYPEGLASALEKIAGSHEELTAANKITAPMYIVNPLQAQERQAVSLFSTHPPIEERVRILRSMAGDVSYKSYQSAFTKISNVSQKLIPDSALKEGGTISVRAPQAQEAAKSPQQVLRDIGDIARAANGFAFVNCACGLKIKIPPDFHEKDIHCPRCQQDINIPAAEMAVAGTVLDSVLAARRTENVTQAPESQQQPQQFLRKTSSWESFRCNCGHLLTVSPLFAGTHMKCPKCQQAIEIKS